MAAREGGTAASARTARGRVSSQSGTLGRRKGRTRRTTGRTRGALRQSAPIAAAKLAQGAHLDANSADTADFQRIPGVGTAYARAIVGYRERLGGFIDARQLTEINGLPYDAANWVRIAPHFQPQRLNLNRASFKALVRHPYLNYEQVKFIVNRRNKIGPLRGWDDLRGCPCSRSATTIGLRLMCLFDHTFYKPSYDYRNTSITINSIDNNRLHRQQAYSNTKNDIYNYTTSQHNSLPQELDR